MDDRGAPHGRETVKRALMGGILALPQAAAWLFTASVLNLTRDREDVFFKPMWLAVLLIGAVLTTGAVFVRGLLLYLKGVRTAGLAATSAVLSMTAALGLAFATAVVTFSR